MKNSALFLASLFLLLPKTSEAQSFTGHLIGGAESFKGPSLPPPGFYVRNYAVFYNASRLNLPSGEKAPIAFRATSYGEILRAVWVSDAEILGANFFADAFGALIQTNVQVNGARQRSLGFGDLYLEPAGLSWHTPHWDAAVGYSIWAPTGDSQPGSAKPGKGFWGQMLAAGATRYLDEQKTWSISALNRYEFNGRERDSHITPGDQWTLECSLVKSLSPALEFGVVGYHQRQITRDSGPKASREKDSVYALGPELNVFWPSIGTFTSLSYQHEFQARDRPQGQLAVLKITKRF
jgi:hypothetical protein